jgi:hypothetical protein
MISDELRDAMALNRTGVWLLAFAVMLVLIMIFVIVAITQSQRSIDDFTTDCEKLGGKVRPLGHHTLCLKGDTVLGQK